MTSEEIINALIEGCDEIDAEERRDDLERLRDVARREGARAALQAAADEINAEAEKRFPHARGGHLAAREILTRRVGELDQAAESES